MHLTLVFPSLLDFPERRRREQQVQHCEHQLRPAGTFTSGRELEIGIVMNAYHWVRIVTSYRICFAGASACVNSMSTSFCTFRSFYLSFSRCHLHQCMWQRPEKLENPRHAETATLSWRQSLLANFRFVFAEYRLATTYPTEEVGLFAHGL